MRTIARPPMELESIPSRSRDAIEGGWDSALTPEHDSGVFKSDWKSFRATVEEFENDPDVGREVLDAIDQQLEREDWRARPHTYEEILTSPYLDEYVEGYSMYRDRAARGFEQPIVYSYEQGYKRHIVDNTTGTVMNADPFVPRGFGRTLQDIDILPKYLSLEQEITAQNGKIAHISAGISSDNAFLFTRLEPLTRSSRGTKNTIDGGRNSTMIVYSLPPGAELYAETTQAELRRQLDSIPDALLHSHDSSETTRDMLEQALDRVATDQLPPATIEEGLLRGRRPKGNESQERDYDLAAYKNRTSMLFSTYEQALQAARLGTLPNDTEELWHILDGIVEDSYAEMPARMHLASEEKAVIIEDIHCALAAKLKDRRFDRYEHTDAMAARLEEWAQHQQTPELVDEDISTQEEVPKSTLEAMPPEKKGWMNKLKERGKVVAAAIGATAVATAVAVSTYMSLDATSEEPQSPESSPVVEAPEMSDAETIVVESAPPAFVEEVQTVERGDSVWNMSREVLEAYGVENPTNQQVLEVTDVTLEAHDLTHETAEGIDPGQEIAIRLPGSHIK